jgi:hypothetical protein
MTDRLPLDNTAFYDLMSEAQDELAGADRDAAVQGKADAFHDLLDEKHWAWLSDFPPVRPNVAHDEFRKYLQHYIDQMATLRKAAPDDFVLPQGHLAAIHGERLKDVLEEMSPVPRPTTLFPNAMTPAQATGQTSIYDLMQRRLADYERQARATDALEQQLAHEQRVLEQQWAKNSHWSNINYAKNRW